MSETAISFTQYLLPDGRTKQVSVNRPADIAAMARELQLRGLKFDVEILTTGAVSMTVEDEATEETLAHEVVANGPGMGEAVDRLVRTAYESVSTQTLPPDNPTKRGR